MALPDISIEYYQYDPELTSAKTLIYGRLISTHEGTLKNDVTEQSTPGMATYCSVFVCKQCFLELSSGTPSVGATRRHSLAAGERRDFMIGPQQTDTITIGYKLA